MKTRRKSVDDYINLLNCFFHSVFQNLPFVANWYTTASLFLK